MMTFKQWAATRERVTNLKELVADDVTPEGLVYRGPDGHVCGYIEEIGPDFYILHLSNEQYSAYGEDVKQLEERLWNDHARYELNR